MILDLLILLVLAIGFVLGFFRGLVRQLLALGAWLVTFVGSAQLRVPLGDWLSGTSTAFTHEYALLLAFLSLFLATFISALLLAELGGAASGLTKYPWLDDVLGGVVGVAVAVLFVVSLVVILDSYFVPVTVQAVGEVGWLRGIHADVSASSLVDTLREWVIRPLAILLGPLVPEDVRAVMS